MAHSTRQPANGLIWAAMIVLFSAWLLPGYLREVRSEQRLLAEKHRVCQMLDGEKIRHERLQERLKKLREHPRPRRYIQPSSDQKVLRFGEKSTTSDTFKIVALMAQINCGSPSVYACGPSNDMRHLLTVREVLAAKSNIGTARMALELSRHRHLKLSSHPDGRGKP